MIVVTRILASVPFTSAVTVASVPFVPTSAYSVIAMLFEVSSVRSNSEISVCVPFLVFTSTFADLKSAIGHEYAVAVDAVGTLTVAANSFASVPNFTARYVGDAVELPFAIAVVTDPPTAVSARAFVK